MLVDVVYQNEAADCRKASKPAFKLAAYGVKQGGIGSVLAGGFPTLKKTGSANKKTDEEPVRTKRYVLVEFKMLTRTFSQNLILLANHRRQVRSSLKHKR